MTTERTETQNLEDILNNPSTETEEVSGEAETQGQKEPTSQTIPAPEKVETPEQQLESRVQSEADKRVQSYRQTREADTALIRSLQTQVKDLKTRVIDREADKLITTIIEGDEEEGLEADKIEARKKALDSFKVKLKEYNEKATDILESAQVISSMTEQMPANIVKEFGLNDPNPVVRAVNGIKFLDEAISVYRHNQNFLMAMEEFLPKGDELRKQLDEIVEGMAEFENEKSKKLYLESRMKGLKVTPRKRPAVPSDTSGGMDISKLSPGEKVHLGLQKLRNK